MLGLSCTTTKGLDMDPRDIRIKELEVKNAKLSKALVAFVE